MEYGSPRVVQRSRLRNTVIWVGGVFTAVAAASICMLRANGRSSLSGIVTSRNDLTIVRVVIDGPGRTVVMRNGVACEQITAALKESGDSGAPVGEWCSLTLEMSNGSVWNAYCYVSSGVIQFRLPAPNDPDEVAMPTHKLVIPHGSSKEWDEAFDLLLSDRRGVMCIDHKDHISWCKWP